MVESYLFLSAFAGCLLVFSIRGGVDFFSVTPLNWWCTNGTPVSRAYRFPHTIIIYVTTAALGVLTLATWSRLLYLVVAVGFRIESEVAILCINSKVGDEK